MKGSFARVRLLMSYLVAGSVCLGVSQGLSAQTILLVTNGNSSLTSEETARKTQFESWGYTVATIWDDDSQSNVDSAVASADVVYIPEEVYSSDVSYKFRTVSIGVVSEEPYLDDELGFATSHGGQSNVTNQILVTNNSHQISSGLSTGYITIFDSTQPRIYLQGTQAAGLQELATGSSGDLMLGYLETGAALANTYNGNSTASGRRVRLPWGGSSFAFSSLDSDGLSILQNALSWAASGGSSGEPVYLSTGGSAGLGSLSFQDEDVVEYDPAGGTAVMRIDGSTLFSGNDINAVHAFEDGVVIFSAQSSGTIAGVSFLDGDLVRYDPNSGTASIFLEGASVFAYTSDIDAAHVMSSGNILLSTASNSQIGSLSFRDEDVVEYNPNLGTATIYFDGSAIGASGDVDGVYLKEDGNLLLSMRNSETYGGLSSNDEDIVEYDPSGDTATIYFDGSSHYTANEDTDALSLIDPAISDALVAHWKFDETSGTTASDSSGNGHDGTLVNGPTWTTDAPRNGGIHINSAGSNDRVDAGTFDVSGSQITLAAWVKTDTFSNDSRIIMKSDGNGSSNQSWGLIVDENGSAEIRINAGGSFVRLIEYGIITQGNWHHLLGTYDGTTMKLYVDGVFVKSQTHGAGGDLDTSSSKTVTIGDSVVGGRRFYGQIDDARVYSKVLTDAEIAEVYGLIAHWKLDETTGTTATDSSLANNDASRTGTESWTTGQDNGAHNFDYTNGEEYFTAPTNTLLNEVQEDDFTMMAYFKPNSVPPGSESSNTGRYSILSKYGWHAGLFYNNEGEFQTDHYYNGNNWHGAGSWDISYPSGKFYHVAAVYSKTNGTTKLYVNGVEVGSNTFTAGTDAREYGSEPWRIGVSNPGGGGYGWPCDGVIDDVRIYNRALSADELAKYASGDPGLIAHWTFDEGTGTTISDSSGNGNNASFNTGTPAWTSGIRGGALSFNGNNDAHTDLNFNPPSVGSVAFWYRPNATPTSTQRLFGLGDDWEVFTGSSGRIALNLTNSSTGDFKTQDYVAKSGQWQHIVAIYDSDNNAYKVYLNGELLNSGSQSMDAQSAAIMSFGTRTGSTERFNGALDDVRVYNYELTPAEIAEIYGLVGHWKLEETSGSTVSDSSGMGNDGIFSGSSTWSTDAKEGSGSLQLDGTDYVDISETFYDDAPDGLTLAGWAKLTSTDNGGGELITIGNTFGLRLDMQYTSWGTYSFLYTGSNWEITTSNKYYENTGWHHFVATYDSRSLTNKLYVDGVLESTVNLTGPLASSSGTTTRIGAHGNGQSDYDFAGNVDDLRVYNRPITVAEVNDLYGRLAHWKLDETSGTVATDSTEHGNDGSYTGSPTLGVNGAYTTNTATAVSLNGSSEYIDTNNSLVNDMTAFTMLGWVRVDDVDTVQSFFGQNNAIEMGIQNNAGELHLWTENGGSLSANNKLSIGKWTHIAVIGDGTNLKIYVNGRETASGGTGTANYGDSSDGFMLGAGVINGSADYLDGRLDDVQVFNRALDPTEIFNIYKGGRPSGVRILSWLESR